MGKSYLCIDLKSFYASVECVERGLDPMTTKLVVADRERSDKTICLAVTPVLKQLGISNRCRLFEIPSDIEYIIASPRMQLYIDYSAEIYAIYLRYFSKDDIHVYSVDEVFIDVTPYLNIYQFTAKELAQELMLIIRQELGIWATCGIGTNLYLAKIALDIMAKHAPDCIAVLDEESYRQQLWDHKPLTDFWRIGKGTQGRLLEYGISTMRQVAEADEDLLYKIFGIDAELLIDHAWGREPVTIADIKAYKPKSRCIAHGQVLMRDYSFDEAKIIIKEMIDMMCLELVDQEMLTNSVSLYVGYSNSLHVPPAKGSVHLDRDTSADMIIIPAVLDLYQRCVDPNKSIRRVNISFNNLIPETVQRQLCFFDSAETSIKRKHQVQKTVIGIKKRYGNNSILKGTNFEPAATGRERNRQIGGHKSGE